jgi:hypothetical protein
MFQQQVTEIPGVLIGRVTGIDDQGLPIVSTAKGERVAAAVVWMREAPRWADCVGLRVVVAHLEEDDSRPLVLGLLDAPPGAAARVPETLKVESRRELVIECGKSKIALRADGRIEIRGGHLISRSSGPNKIKGGTVHIN